MSLIKHMNKEYTIAGIMSGTSLDGLDVCIARFSESGYSILAADTLSYSAQIVDSLNTAHLLGIDEFIRLHNWYGNFIGRSLYTFVKSHGVAFDYVASHGHTILHRPDKGYTFQIGSGAEIAAVVCRPVISDFRSLDVALGGQGAPLVPIGDALLFSEYDYCINIGGFANISFNNGDKRIAFDISPANYVLNYLCQKLGKNYDENGSIARSGVVNQELLRILNANSYFTLVPPKSLGREWVEHNVYRIVDFVDDSLPNIISTYTEHVAFQIGTVCLGKNKKALVTGGGAFNLYMIELIEKYCECKIVIPTKEIIEYKEALIFAYLGYLRIAEQINTLASVTGAKRNSVGGVISFY